MSTRTPPEIPPEPAIAATLAPARTSLLPRLLAGLALLGVAMTGTAMIAPSIALRTSGSDHPDYAVIAGTGVAMIALTSLFLAYTSRVIGLGAAWFVLALAYNALILVAKFVLGPGALYQTTFVAGDPLLNVKSPNFFPWLAISVFLAYAAVLGVIYAVQRGRVRRAIGPDASPRSGAVTGVVILALVLGCPVLLFLGFQVVAYGNVVTTASGGAVLLVLALALAAGIGALRQAARTSIAMRDIAILTSVFWMALSLLLIYHVVWVIFMTALIGLWPLKTVAPSSK